ncbi:hypothetical protein F511_19069 [Dorcoceras hygrometricum]|uniref:Uncharacterized protein n=1 Tax=Dorcoceras hygrometricum TaxID=472368 RepID=A0A2Z7D1A1_9LAMI|nr:hypothetical protein F511_19069 [Dorcoceras hygrometricum]
MQEIKATTESKEPKNRKTSQQQDLIKGMTDRQWPQGILSTWELPTHLQYTIPDANIELHLLFRSASSSEVYRELPATSSSPASCCKLAHNPYLNSLCNNYYKPIATMTSRAHRSTTCSTKALNQAQGRNFTYPKNLGAKSDAYDHRLYKGDVFAHLTSFKKTFENNIHTKRLSKRSPTLPLLLQSELSTVDNRRR